MALEKHHGAFDRLSWSARKEGRWIRNNPANIYMLEHDPHHELHDAVPIVPVLGWHALQQVAGEYEPHHDPMVNIDRLVAAIERTKRHPRAHQIERDLADLTIHAFELQRPFILDNRNRHDN